MFRLKHNVFQNSQLSYQVDLSNIGIEKLNILVNSLINLALNCLGAYLLLKDQLSYGTLIMGLNLFNYLTYSTNQVIDFSFFRIDFRFSGQIYLSFLNIANHQKNGQQ